MVKLALFKDSPIDKVHARLNDAVVVGDKRGYLGMSVIGHKCHRYLQFVHYGCLKSTYSQRIDRLFSDGHNAEPQLIEALELIGIKVQNEQKQVVGITGHVQGHIDGNGYWVSDEYALFDAKSFLVEFKTHNQKSFDELLKNDLLKCKPLHYSQMVSYMGHQNQEFGLYVAKNKNTSEIHVRVIDFDENHFDDLRRKEIEVVTADTLLPRIGNDSPKWFECKMCGAADVCFGKKSIEHDCRNCKHVDVLDGGKWLCNITGNLIADHSPCEQYAVGEMFDCTN